MKRDLTKFSGKVYDLFIIGGGIYGVWIAWDAALRGLSVGLIDKGDFGSATSSNTMKIIHGGLRYLQHLDFSRMRQSIYERMVLMRIAPHLVHPLPFLMPIYGHLIRGIMSLALMLDNIIGFDRNRLKDPKKYLPRGRLISKAECMRLLPGVEDKGLSGGAIWYDCQMSNSERLLLSVLRSAVEAGADVSNYVEATGFLREGNRVMGIKAKDVFSGEGFEIPARIVVNASGPWVDHVLSLLGSRRARVHLSKAINLIVNHQIIPGYGVGIPSRTSPRLLFITPWRNYSLIGTAYTSYEAHPDGFRVTEKDIQDFIDEINEAYPALALRQEDVTYFHGGLIPVDKKNYETGDVKPSKRYQILNHLKEDGIDGMISVIGVKYTTARDVAEKTIDLVFKRLGKRSPRCLTTVIPIYGGKIGHFNNFLIQEVEKGMYGMDAEVMKHLIYNYGSEYHQVSKYLREDPDWGQKIIDSSQVIKAQVLHGIRDEMAQKLSDIIFRRTELGSAGNPGDACLKTCATIMAKELGWDEVKTERELDETKAIFSAKT